TTPIENSFRHRSWRACASRELRSLHGTACARPSAPEPRVRETRGPLAAQRSNRVWTAPRRRRPDRSKTERIVYGAIEILAWLLVASPMVIVTDTGTPRGTPAGMRTFTCKT